MKSWKKQFKDELKPTVPNLSEKVKYLPIVVNKEENIINGNTLTKRRINTSAIFAGIILMLTLGLLAIFGVFKPKQNLEQSVFVYEINPSVVFVTDKDGIVQSVKALNNDADVILSDETEVNKLKNISLSQAIVVYTDTASKLGFLDLTKSENAVKLTSNNEANTELINTIKSSLKTYFCEKGIFAVIVEEKANLQTLSEKIGIENINSFSNLVENLNLLSNRFGERVNENANEEQLENLYKSYVLGEQFIELVKKDLLSNISQITRNAQMLLNISSLNLQITCHADNPQILANYWDLIEQEHNYTNEFSTLMSEMQEKLLEYKTTFNKEINSFSDFVSLLNVYSSQDSLIDKISNLTSTDFIENISNYVGMLTNIGIDVSSWDKLLNAPKTINEYLEQTQLIIDLLKNNRLENNESIYNENRKEISESEYDNFVAAVEKRYGSLLQYWENK